jgi:RecQ-mediated genome instability protein 1
MSTPLATQITTTLTAANLPAPHANLLASILSSSRNAPLPALIATARHRILFTDLTSPSLLASTTLSFPPNLSNALVQELKLPGPLPVQVLGIEDLSKSKWEQVEAIEAAERGEMTKGREVIQVLPQDDNETSTQTTMPNVKGRGPHRLVLQDTNGQRVYAMELKDVPKIDLNLPIGAKLMLQGCLVARGVVLLEPSKVTVIGGKVEILHKTWAENRKKDLMEAAGLGSGA